MPTYVVRWEIDVDASDHRDAAEQARDAQTRAGTTATVFDVYQVDFYGNPIADQPIEVDLAP